MQRLVSGIVILPLDIVLDEKGSRAPIYPENLVNLTQRTDKKKAIPLKISQQVHSFLVV